MMDALMINQLNALAKRLPRAVFKVQGTLDRVTYVYVSEDVVIYVGEGYPERATKRLEEQGVNSDDFDYVIANCGCEVYLAASNITKAVAVEFEDILCREFNPPFNEKPTSSIWRTLPEGPDTFSAMRSAEKKGDYQFPTPRDTHVAEWKRCRNDEIPLDWVITRTGLRRKNNKDPLEQMHYNNYPPLGQTTTVSEHRRRNEELGLTWNRIKSILHWDCLYPDLITITPPEGSR